MDERRRKIRRVQSGSEREKETLLKALEREKVLEVLQRDRLLRSTEEDRIR